MNKSNNSVNEVWGILDMVNDEQAGGYIKFSIRANEQNKKIIGQANDFFYDDEILGDDNTKNYITKDINNNGLPTFTKFDISVYILTGQFAEIPNLTENKNFKFRVFLNPNISRESNVINEKIANWKKEIKFTVFLPFYIDRIIVEIYSDKYLKIIIYLNKKYLYLSYFYY